MFHFENPITKNGRGRSRELRKLGAIIQCNSRGTVKQYYVFKSQNADLDESNLTNNKYAN